MEINLNDPTGDPTKDLAAAITSAVNTTLCATTTTVLDFTCCH